MKIFSYLFILFLLSSLLQNCSVAQESIPKIHPELQIVLENASDEETIDVYIMLKDRYSLEALKLQTRFLSKKEKRKKIVRILRNYAEEKQQTIIAFLMAEEKVNRINVLWATNTIILSACRKVIYSLVDFAEVKEIRYDRKFSMGVPDNGQAENSSGNNGADIDPGIELIRADDVWAEGYYGQGVFMASIDEDCNWDHPDIVNNIWNNLGEDADGDGHTLEPDGNGWVFDPGDLNGVDDDGNGYVDDLIGWDFVNNDNDVYGNQPYAHGLKTAGVAVGDGTLGTKTGVAPQATLVPLRIGKNWEQQQTYCWLAMQYSIEVGVDIITHSQSFHWDDGPPDVAMFRDLAVLELEAGIIHFTSISNDGNHLEDTSIPFNISTPGNCPPPWLHPDQTLIGGTSSIMAVGNVSADSDEIHSSSPYGPSSQEDYSINNFYPYSMPEKYWDYPYETILNSIGLLKPDISSPGARTISLYGEHGSYGYDSFNGTSSATPHAAGTAALLLSVNPNLTPADISRILQLSSVDKGEPGHDDRYGAGRIDAYNAYLMVLNEITNVKTEEDADLENYQLFQIYPNPFNPLTIIKYQILETSFVTIKVFDVLGNEVETLVNKETLAGIYQVYFDGTKQSSGIYFYKLLAGNFVETKKLVLLK